MRHLLLALPLLASATGCAEPCTSPALTVSWRFVLADGSGEAGCQTAGVEQVSLWLDGVPAGLGMSCAQGSATFAGQASGDHVFTIQGLSAGGAVLYQEWGALSVDGCGETRVTLRPGAGYLRIAYATTTGSCSGAGDPPAPFGFIWYWVMDLDTGQLASSVNVSRYPDALPCQTAAGQAEVNVRLPYGNYSLLGVQDVRYPLATNPTPIFQYCLPIPRTVHAPGLTSIDVLLDLPAGPCNL
jgi:hypothetical protein